MTITIADLKAQLNIESSFTDDDTLIQFYIDVAEEAVYKELNKTDEELAVLTADLPNAIKQAIILFASNLYINRNMVTFSQGYELPYSFKFLINKYINTTIQ